MPQAPTWTTIRFNCEIRLPLLGAFPLYHEFKKNPEKFLKAWLEGAVGNIYHSPVQNVRDIHDGHLLIQPVVAVRYLKPHAKLDLPRPDRP